MDDLAVIVVSANGARWLRACVSSVHAHAGSASLDVVVVAAGCTDDTAELVRELPGARVVECDNRGFAYGNNRGFLTTSAPYILFLNPDTEIRDGTFAELLDLMHARPEVGLVGVRQVAADGTLWPTMRRFPRPVRWLFEAFASERLPLRGAWLGERVLDPSVYEQESSCDWTSGSFMLARREALLAAGLMDERFFIYCEEPDLCLRIAQAGWDVRHLPAMTILHHGGDYRFDPKFLAQEAFSRRQYMRKHFSPLGRVAGTFALALGYGLRALLGGRDREHARAQRAASRAALAALLGHAPAPFAEPGAHAVAPEADWGRPAVARASH